MAMPGMGGPMHHMSSIPMFPPRLPMHMPGPMPVQPMSYGVVALPPNETLYVNNLNDRIKPEILKKHLTSMFKQFGTVKDVIAMRSLFRRGQAFVIFEDIESATKAMNGLQGFPFYSKPLRINFAKRKSKVIALERGIPLEQAAKLSEKTAEPEIARATQSAAPYAERGAAQEAPSGKEAAVEKAAGAPAPAAPVPKPRPTFQPIPQPALPNRVLFVENLPEDCTEMMLKLLFQQYAGFQEARVIPQRRVAFVDYENELQAGIAMTHLQGFAMAPGTHIDISYAKS